LVSAKHVKRAGRAMTNRAWSVKAERRTKAEVDAVKRAINTTLEAEHPMTVRQVFYRLVVADVIDKTEHEYKNTVIRLLTDMRISGEIPFSWIIDGSRHTHQTETFNNVADALQSTARYYRRSALRNSDCYIEIWCEKDALSGLIWEAASDYDVPVVVSKGTP